MRYGGGSMTPAILLVALSAAPCEKDCVEIGDRLVKSDATRMEALAAYQRACDRGVPRGCSKLAFRLVERSRDKADVAKAIALNRKACDANDALGCTNLATFYWDGEGVPADVKKAV